MLLRGVDTHFFDKRWMSKSHRLMVHGSRANGGIMSQIQYPVLVVEDDAVVRSRLCQTIRAEPGLEILADVGTFHAARSVLGRRLPRLALIDLELPDGDGAEIIQWLSVQADLVDSLVLSVFGDERHVVSAIEAGASGYLLKGEESDNVGPMLKRVLAGESPISPAVARHILTRARNSTKQADEQAPNSMERLTPTELEVLRYIAKGYSAPEIARMTNRAPTTVPVHIRNIYRKLSVHSRGEAVFEAVQLGLINPGRR